MVDERTADFVLIPGLWLTGRAWDEVARELEQRGRGVRSLTLPGQGDGADATLEDQVAAVLSAVDASDRAVVVGHSAAATLAWIAADRRPDRVARVVLVGGFPARDGDTYADFFPPDDGVVAFPGWAPFEGPDAADLDATARALFEDQVVPVPASVTRGVVRLGDPRRLAVPVTLVCPEFSPADAAGWIAAGDLPELASAASVEYLDIDSGHWPMVTRPVELAAMLDALAT